MTKWVGVISKKMGVLVAVEVDFGLKNQGVLFVGGHLDEMGADGGGTTSWRFSRGCVLVISGEVLVVWVVGVGVGFFESGRRGKRGDLVVVWKKWKCGSEIERVWLRVFLVVGLCEGEQRGISFGVMKEMEVCGLVLLSLLFSRWLNVWWWGKLFT